MSRAARIALVNPNTNVSATEAMVEIAQAAAPAHVTIHGVTVETGVPLITHDGALAKAAVAVEALAPKLSLPDEDGQAMYDAVIVAAFGDPGCEGLARRINEIRCNQTSGWRLSDGERVAIANGALGPGGLAARRGLVPVIGIGAASCAEAARLSDGRFAVATTIGGLSGAIRKLADDAGCGAALTSVLAPAGDPAALMADARATEETLAALISRAIEDDGARAVVIGGGPLAKAARALAPRFSGCTIVEPIPVAVAAAAADVRRARRVTDAMLEKLDDEVAKLMLKREAMAVDASGSHPSTPLQSRPAQWDPDRTLKPEDLVSGKVQAEAAKDADAVERAEAAVEKATAEQLAAARLTAAAMRPSGGSCVPRCNFH